MYSDKNDAVGTENSKETKSTVLRNFQIFAITTFRILFRPYNFFHQYYSELNSEKRDADSISFSKYIVFAVIFVSIMGTINQTLVKIGGYTEADYARELLVRSTNNNPGLIDALFEQVSEIEENKTGDRIKVPIVVNDKIEELELLYINLNALTGNSNIDQPLAEIFQLMLYFLLAALFWLVSLGKLPFNMMAAYYGFVLGATRALIATLGFIARLIYINFALNEEFFTGWNVISFVETVAILPVLIFLFIIPTLVLAKIVGVSKWRMFLTTIIAWIFYIGFNAALVWMLIWNGISLDLPTL